ncbi:MAG: hypothetical protein ACJAVF_004508, partial [Paraglaciecola sp.]
SYFGEFEGRVWAISPNSSLKNTQPAAFGGGGGGSGERKIGFFFIKIQFSSPLKPLCQIQST